MCFYLCISGALLELLKEMEELTSLPGHRLHSYSIMHETHFHLCTCWYCLVLRMLWPSFCLFVCHHQINYTDSGNSGDAATAQCNLFFFAFIGENLFPHKSRFDRQVGRPAGRHFTYQNWNIKMHNKMHALHRHLHRRHHHRIATTATKES